MVRKLGVSAICPLVQCQKSSLLHKGSIIISIATGINAAKTIRSGLGTYNLLMMDADAIQRLAQLMAIVSGTPTILG
ncbi:MAG: hypothetical protein AAF135_27420, partial [Bacteroidota bacterium]